MSTEYIYGELSFESTYDCYDEIYFHPANYYIPHGFVKFGDGVSEILIVDVLEGLCDSDVLSLAIKIPEVAIIELPKDENGDRWVKIEQLEIQATIRYEGADDLIDFEGEEHND